MSEAAPAIVAVVGTLLGVALTFLAQSRVSAKQITEARRDRRRNDFIAAASEVAAATTKMLQTEYNRAKTRLEPNTDADISRQLTKQESYDRRSDAHLARYKLQLVSRPGEDSELLKTVEAVIGQCQAVSDAATLTDLTTKHRAAKEASKKLIEELNRLVDGYYR